MSPEDYLRLEREAEYKHEYYAGEIRAMAGASFAHNLVCANLTINLGNLLRGRSCTPLDSDQRVHVKNKSSFLYPALSVVCSQPEFLEDKKSDTLLNPVFLAEVLSTSKDKGRGEKFMLYRQIPSLRHYLLLDSEWAPSSRSFMSIVCGTTCCSTRNPFTLSRIHLITKATEY